MNIITQNTTTIFIIIAIIIAVTALTGNKKGKKKTKGNYTYKAKKIMVENELKLFQILKSCVRVNQNISCQVSMRAIISATPIDGNNFFGQKYLDFVIHNDKGNVELIIELDGASHNNDKQQDRDDKKNDAIEKAGIPFIRIKNSDLGNTTALSVKIKEKMYG